MRSPQIGVPATHLERQSQMSYGSHGTHVASIAAGNSGVCSNSLIAGVLIALSENDYDRRKSFYDSMSVAHAVDYLVNLATELNLPLSINISLGTNGHAHDGSDVVSRWVDAELLKPGVSVCVAAGNAGQEAPVSEDDYGFVMGRIHTSGNIKSAGLSEDIHWRVVGNGIADISENELEIWYDSQDNFSVEIKPPGMDWIGPIGTNQFMQNIQLSDGSYVSIYNEQYHPSNGLNYIGIYLIPGMYEDETIIPVRAGTWLVRLHGVNVRNGSYHGWIERDDPRRSGPIGDREKWNFPSFFEEVSNVDNTSISSLACAHYVIAVANIDTESNKVNISSSQGPTRDERCKPEIGASGTNVVAAKGFSTDPNDLWIAKTGTSMASPYVCGVVGNMLQVNPILTAAQISGILKRTSSPLPGRDYTWKNDQGYGLINPEACLQEAESIKTKQEVQP
ncbi:S8 family serine peptidase [Bacteroidota bacterium]